MMFHDLLKEKRIKRRLTLREFCRRAEEDPANLSRIERGLRTPPNDDVLARYAKVLELEGDELQNFMYVGAVARRELPKGIPIEALVDKLPAMLRTIDGGKPTDEQLDKVIDITKRTFSL